MEDEQYLQYYKPIITKHPVYILYFPSSHPDI